MAVVGWLPRAAPSFFATLLSILARAAMEILPTAAAAVIAPPLQSPKGVPRSSRARASKAAAPAAAQPRITQTDPNTQVGGAYFSALSLLEERILNALAETEQRVADNVGEATGAVQELKAEVAALRAGGVSPYGSDDVSRLSSPSASTIAPSPTPADGTVCGSSTARSTNSSPDRHDRTSSPPSSRPTAFMCSNSVSNAPPAVQPTKKRLGAADARDSIGDDATSPQEQIWALVEVLPT